MSSSSWGCELKFLFVFSKSMFFGHPLREDVSWNDLAEIDIIEKSRHPLREDVSWNVHTQADDGKESSHPLREDVSWNICKGDKKPFRMSHPLREDVSWNNSSTAKFSSMAVILFVRMWVEMLNLNLAEMTWAVILFVRMWVEILKAIYQIATEDSHPLREDVSWNVDNCSVFEILPVILFVRMWVEIDWLF